MTWPYMYFTSRDCFDFQMLYIISFRYIGNDSWCKLKRTLLTPLVVFCMLTLIKKTYGNSSLSVKIVVLTIDKTSELLFLANCSQLLFVDSSLNMWHKLENVWFYSKLNLRIAFTCTELYLITSLIIIKYKMHRWDGSVVLKRSPRMREIGV